MRTGETGYRCLKYCDKCRIFFTPYEIYQQDINGWELLNPNDQKRLATKWGKRNKSALAEERTPSVKFKPLPLTFKKILDSRIFQKSKSNFVISLFAVACSNAKKSGHKLSAISQESSRIMNKAGGTEEVSVPAGHCPMCNRYFIMEDTYQSLKFKGTILCRVSDEENLFKL